MTKRNHCDNITLFGEAEANSALIPKKSIKNVADVVALTVRKTRSTSMYNLDFFGPKSRHPLGMSSVEYVETLRQITVPTRFRPIAFHSLQEKNNLPDLIYEGIAIAGAGLMGISIAAAFLQKEIPVLLFDISAEALNSAEERIARELTLRQAAPVEQVHRLIAQFLRCTDSLPLLGTKRYIIETIYEKLKVKQKFYRQLDPFCHHETVLLSNTSTIKIDSLVSSFTTPCKNLSAERFSGFHFFHPVRKRTLLEIIPSSATSMETTTLAVQLAYTIDKTPLVVQDGPGFLVNRLLNPYLNEALALLEEGVPLERIEETCYRFGMEIGPFRIMDEIGLDVALHSGWSIQHELPYAVTAAKLLPAMLEDRRLGRKNGRGFRLYQSTKNQWEDSGTFDPTLLPLVQKVSRTIFDENLSPTCTSDMTDEMITARIFLPILLEAGRIVEAGIVDSLPLTDAALVLGLGFPPHQGGICWWADCIGLESLLMLADQMTALGERFQVPNILRNRSFLFETLPIIGKIPTCLNSQ